MCCSPGEERPADAECEQGQAMEAGHGSAERLGGSGGRTGGHAAPHEPDPPEHEETERDEVRGSGSHRHRVHEGEQKAFTEKDSDRTKAERHGVPLTPPCFFT